MDDIFSGLGELTYEFENANKIMKDIHEEKLEENFNLKIEEYFADKKAQDLIGKYGEYASNSDERFINFSKFLDDCVENTKLGIFKEGDALYMNSRHAKNLKDEAAKMFSFCENIMLKSASDRTSKYDMQAYLNDRSVGKRGENKESTLQGIKNKIQKINLLENLARGEKMNYSSNIKTLDELSQFKNLKNTKVKASDENQKNKGMSQSDYNKIYNNLYGKLIDKPEKITDSEVAFLLAGEFGLRPSTILKININQVDVRGCGIEVEAEDNKSKQTFISKTSAIEPVSFETQQLLSALYQRALLLHKANEDENVRLISCSEQNLHQGYTSILKKHGVSAEKYEGKYKSLRHMYAQRIYSEHREEYLESKGTTVEKQARALKEVNYLMGHESKKINNTMKYIKNLW